jgi:2-methylisocitrate lyase-like PEP mutase family enzyme
MVFIQGYTSLYFNYYIWRIIMAIPDLKKKLSQKEMVLCGGVWDALSAIIEERAGLKAVKLGSSQLNASMGLPDLGLVTAAEVRDRIYMITGHINIPLMVDFESGFGSEKDIISAVYWAKEFERAGASAIHIDDYGDDKCPWLPPYIPVLMSAESIADKIKAICDHRKSEDFLIMVRSGATSSCAFVNKEDAFEESMRRFHLWKKAGADIVWPRVFKEEHLFRARDELGGFLSQSVASKVGQGRVGSGGRTEAKYYSAQEYHEIGYNFLTVGATMQTILMKALTDASKILLESGGDPQKLDPLAMPFNDWIELVNFSQWNSLRKD